MQELWVVWVAGVTLIGLSVAAQVLASRFGRRERKAGDRLDPLGVFDSTGDPAWHNILIGMLRVMGLFFLAVGVTVSAIVGVLPG